MSNTKPINVLIVNDSENNPFTLHSLIKNYLNIHILEANSEPTALKIVMTHPVDLIILDVQILAINDFEMVKNLRSWEKVQHIPIICLIATCHNSEEFQQQGFAVGITDYVTKPIDTHQLINRLQAYIRFIEQDRQQKQELEYKVQERTAELLEARNQLEQRVEERTAELALAKKKAEQAQAIAEAANLAKSKFLANMSHELRTPLNGILGYAQILTREIDLKAKQKEAVNIIHRNGEYLLTLISDILDLSKIEAGRIELHPSNFHFGNFLQNIIEIFEMRAQQKGISFIYEKLSHLPKGVCADEKRLRQILIHLLSNAIKFTEKGCVCLKVGYHHNKIRFLVEDTGIGIAMEDLDKIFQPFHQAGDSNLQTEGAGLGLAITKTLVEMMGGKLQVNSTLGKGSAFWMALDLPKVSDWIILEKTSKPNIVSFQGESRQILIADDKEVNRTVLINLLAPLGFEIIEAVDGQDCVNQAREYQPDLILIDLVMPKMDGFEATRQIRRIPELKKAIIIMASTSAFDCHKQPIQEVLCDDFITKPIYAEELLQLLEKHLGLTWIYDTEENITEKSSTTDDAISEAIQEQPEQTPRVNISERQATILFDLAMRGDLDELVERLNEFEQAEPKLACFANKVRGLAKDFEEEKICELVEQYINK